jgi:hypothetical protein
VASGGQCAGTVGDQCLADPDCSAYETCEQPCP